MTERDDELDRLTKQVCEFVDHEMLRELAVGMVNIPSPTGEERVLAEWTVDHLRAVGVEARVQPLDGSQANAVGRVRGSGDGPSLLLYAPIDTLTTGNAAEDEPWAASPLRPDMLASSRVDGDYVVGLGASNPKVHAATLVAVVEALHAARVELAGDLWLGLGAGGMPTNRRPGAAGPRANSGQGVGCSFLVEQGVYPDHALIAKPGWAVAWEEVGLCWFEIVVRGTFGYVGSRHRMNYVNPVVEAGKVAAGLEAWFPQYTEQHTRDTLAPQGNIGAIQAGWMHMPAVSSAEARLMVDLRIVPDTPPNVVRREFSEAMRAIQAANPGLDVSWEMVLSIPGTLTKPSDRIVRAAIAAWEHETGRPHEPILGNSGATDANILRGRGIPTARIGMDRIGPGAPLALDFPAGMNVVDVREMERLARHVIRTTLDVCALPEGQGP